MSARRKNPTRTTHQSDISISDRYVRSKQMSDRARGIFSARLFVAELVHLTRQWWVWRIQPTDGFADPDALDLRFQNTLSIPHRGHIAFYSLAYLRGRINSTRGSSEGAIACALCCSSHRWTSLCHAASSFLSKKKKNRKNTQHE